MCCAAGPRPLILSEAMVVAHCFPPRPPAASFGSWQGEAWLLHVFWPPLLPSLRDEAAEGGTHALVEVCIGGLCAPADRSVGFFLFLSDCLVPGRCF